MENVKLNLGPGNIASPLPISDERLYHTPLGVATILYREGRIPDEIFAILLNNHGYAMRELYPHGAKVTREVWTIIAPGATYVWDDSLLGQNTSSTSSSTTTTPGQQPNIEFHTSDVSSHIIPLYTFLFTGTWVIKGHIKGDNATNSFGRDFSFIVRRHGGTVDVGPVILGPLDGTTTPIPAFTGTIDNTVSGDTANLNFTAGDTDDTTWTITYGVF